jgi:hypothetical protein
MERLICLFLVQERLYPALSQSRALVSSVAGWEDPFWNYLTLGLVGSKHKDDCRLVVEEVQPLERRVKGHPDGLWGRRQRCGWLRDVVQRRQRMEGSSTPTERVVERRAKDTVGSRERQMKARSRCCCSALDGTVPPFPEKFD